MLSVAKLKKLNITDLFLFLVTWIMEIKTKLKEPKENFEKLANVINENKYLIYEQIFNLIENWRIINDDNYGLIIEIDSEENKHLLDDLTKIFFTRKLGQRRAEKKIGHGYEVGNLFIKVLIHKV